MEVFPITWSAGDVEDCNAFRVTVYGKLPDGREACVHIRFTPYFFVEMPRDWSLARCRLFVTEAAKKHGCNARSTVVERVPMWGFCAARPRRFAQLAFDTQRAFTRARYGLAREGHSTYEACVDPVVRLFHLRGIGPARWMRVALRGGAAADGSTSGPAVPVADVDVEVEVDFTAVGPSDLRCKPPLVLASWDIEARSASGKFPVADNPDDNLIQIATAFQRYGEAEPYHRAVCCLGATDDVDGVQIVCAQHEHGVVHAWADLLREHKVDVLLGYNTHQFDWRYVSGRAGVLLDDATGDPLVELHRLGRAVTGGGEVREFELNSNAYGANRFFVLQTPGVQQLDLLQYLRREHKLDSYSLDNVSAHFLGQRKLDLPAAEIFAKFLGTSADRADIARYAVRDTELPLRLVAKLNVWENLTEMANAVNVPVDYLLNRGQQVKVHSVILGKARQLGYVIPDDRAIGVPEGTKYEGATVLEAKRGAYFDVVAGLDFASLVSPLAAAAVAAVVEVAVKVAVKVAAFAGACTRRGTSSSSASRSSSSSSVSCGLPIAPIVGRGVAVPPGGAGLVDSNVVPVGLGVGLVVGAEKPSRRAASSSAATAATAAATKTINRMTALY
jgi:DNA polymerase delta subunit 1